jgi:hypothetical protein
MIKNGPNTRGQNKFGLAKDFRQFLAKEGRYTDEKPKHVQPPFRLF